MLLSTYMVTNANDSGPGSLREGILEQPDSISFSIGSGPQTITPLSPLPTITHQVIIDATTQPGFAGTPLIELNGVGAGAGANGFTLLVSNSTIRGFIINRFAGAGIAIGGSFSYPSSSNVVEGNYIGTDVSGASAEGNGNGIVLGTTNMAVLAATRIGGTQPGQRNVISGNAGTGILMQIQSVTGTVIQGNYVGTNAAGTEAVPNRGDGIANEFLSSTLNGQLTGTVIGGTSSGARNVISGNLGNGISLFGQYRWYADANLVEGNYIGTNAAGTAAIANGMNGVYLNQTFSNTIGAGNLISGNALNGVLISGFGGFNENQGGNLVTGNIIGLSATGQALGNSKPA